MSLITINYAAKLGVTYRPKPAFSLAFDTLTAPKQAVYNSAAEGSDLRNLMDDSLNTIVEQIYQTNRREDEDLAARAELAGLTAAHAALQLSDSDLLAQYQQSQQALAAKTSENAQNALLAQQRGESLTQAQLDLIQAAADAQDALTSLNTQIAAKDGEISAISTVRDQWQAKYNQAKVALEAIIGGGATDDASFQ